MIGGQALITAQPALLARGAHARPGAARPSSVGAFPPLAPIQGTRSWRYQLFASSRDGAGAAGLPFSEALLQREYELWQRQSELYERLQEQHAADLARFDRERAAWQATELALRAEAAELRAQLLYVMSQLGAAHAAGGGPVVGGAAAAGMPQVPPPSRQAFSQPSQQATIGNRPAAGALPGMAAPDAASSTASSPLSPAEQVKAVVDAVKAGAGPGSPAVPSTPSAHSSTSSASGQASSSDVNPLAAWPQGTESELPAYAADLAAAVAAVDATDVLTGIAGYSLQGRRAGAPERAAAAPPPPVQQPVTQQQQQQQPREDPTPTAAVQEPVAAAPAAEEQGLAAAQTEARGPPPPLTLGADDIFWVNQLHTGLVDLGYYPGDEDIDDFYFGDSTQGALMTMQCCEGLPETGIADEATWARLLGPSLAPKPSRDLTADMMLNVPGLIALAGKAAAPEGATSNSNGGSVATQQQQEEPAAKPYTELFSAALSETVRREPGGGAQDTQRLTVTDTVAAGGKVVSERLEVSATVKEAVSYTDWPVLHEGDGGREVHALHVALTRAGYYPSEDDERWWSFGDGTVAALKTFQACNGYPESGVCDAATWRMLLGDDAHPSEIADLRSGDSADEDLSAQGTDRVWLLGEQRWEDRSRLRRS
ncbi:hypothetical protein ABPG77_002288 [Micractinium sp. CCAP 211/92]